MKNILNFSEKSDVVRFVSEKDVKIINLCHVPEDGRLKTLSFSAYDKNRISDILESGERVDGSNILSFIEPGKSDIYVMPDHRRAFIHPFSQLTTLNIMCDYLDENLTALDVAPKSVLSRAEEKLYSTSRITLKALAELEFYIISQKHAPTLFLGAADRNYHESSPFAGFEDVRNLILTALANIGISTKYGHSEVGHIIDDDGSSKEQHEIEFMPESLAELAEDIPVAKWVVRNVCAKYGVSASFCPKLSLGHAGNGMHVHLCGEKNGKNVVADSDGKLSDEARKMIGGILRLAPSLAAFANPTPVSYLRFIAHKESPMHICWGARNRLALIRIPLWWPFREMGGGEESCRETFEYRAPDAFANTHLLLASVALAAEHGLRNSEESLKTAENLHVEAGGRDLEDLKILPCCCNESAHNLERDRKVYEEDGVFPKRLINGTIDRLKAYNDGNLKKMVTENPDKIEKMIQQYLHYG